MARKGGSVNSYYLQYLGHRNTRKKDLVSVSLKTRKYEESEEIQRQGEMQYIMKARD